MEISDRVPVSICHTDEFHCAVPMEHQVIAYIRRPVREAEPRIEDILAPAPLVKPRAHGDGAARRVPVILRAHVIVLKGLQHIVELIQRGRHFQPQIVQPRLVDHGVLRNREDAVVLRRTDARCPHPLSRREAVDIAGVYGNGAADIRVLLQDPAQVRHIFFRQVRRQVDESAVVPIPGDVIVAESHAHERVRQLLPRDADIDLLAQRLAHGSPVNADSRILLKLIQDYIIVISRAQRALSSHDCELRLSDVRVRHALFMMAVIFVPARRRRQHQAGGKRTGYKPFSVIAFLPLTHRFL